MKVNHSDDKGTLYIEFKGAEVTETKDMGENTLLDLDQNDQIISITVEYASERTDVHNLVLSGIAA